MTIKYISTRGESPALSFEEVVLTGLAPDGGLYLPDRLPAFRHGELDALRSLSYADLAYAVMSRFVDDSIDRDALRSMIADSYRGFPHPEVAPLHKLDNNTHILELFHGPTLAFKDFALQFLGRLLAHILEKRGETATVIGATSGDTGSAAIAGCRGHGAMRIFILHPKGRVSEVQRRQMTTVLDENIHNIALEGTFDDCQAIVKTLFSSHRRGEAGRGRLVAVNSINWARILAQVVYYVYAALKFDGPVSFSVPTGNFGDIYAGYIAKRMGLPIDRLIIATNRNNILTRCLATGIYQMEGVVPTYSPSMDIEVSSNFERLLFDLHDGDAAAVRALMEDLKTKRQFTLRPEALRRFRDAFDSRSVSDEETLATIASVYTDKNYLLDPHSAVGLAAGKNPSPRRGEVRRGALNAQSEPVSPHPNPPPVGEGILGATPLIVLSTAHPAKFPVPVERATGKTPALPPSLSDLMERPERFDTLPNNAGAVRRYIEGG